MNRLLWVVVCAAFVACAKKDKSPPPAPILEPLPSSTELATLHLRGTGQYGATVAIARTPAFGSDAPPALTADPYTAHFETDLPLSVGENTFSVTASNVNGPGAAATLTITRAPAKPASLQLSLDTTIVRADNGTLIARARIGNPEAIPLEGFEIDFTATSGSAGAADGGAAGITATAKTDATGLAVATLTGLTIAGDWSLKAASKDNADASDSAMFVVTGGAPASIALALSALPDGGAGNPELTVIAGTDVQATIVVRDQPQNMLSVPFTLYTDAPGAIIEGSRIIHLDRASAQPYHVVASIPATAATGSQVLTAEGLLTVQPGGPATIVITLPKTTVASGEAIIPAVVEQDGVGNVVANATPSLQWSPAATSLDATTGAYTFGAAGTYTLTATDVANASLTASATLTVVHGPPATLNLSLGASSVAAVGTVSDTVTVLDAAGNVLPSADALVSVVTDAPGAVVAAGQIANLSKAGSFTVFAQVTGTNIADSKPLTVTAGPTTTVHLSLSAFTAAVNDPVPYSVTVLDASGNPTTANASITSSAPAGATTLDGVNHTITESQPGTFTITAQAIDGSGTPIPGATDRQTITIAIPADLSPPTNVAVDAPTGGSIFAPGSTMLVQVQAQDDVALESIRYEARTAGGTTLCSDVALQPAGTTCVGVTGVASCAAVATFSCRIPGNAPVGAVSIIGEATDTSGNTTLSAPVSVQVDLAALLVVGSNITATTLASGGLLDRPTGVVGDAAGNLYVTNNGGSSNVIEIASNGVISALTGGLVARPFDLALDRASSTLFVTLDNTGRVMKLPIGGATSNLVNNGCSGFEGIAYDPTILANTLLTADQGNGSTAFWSSTSPNTNCPTGASADSWNGRLNTPYGITDRTSGVAGDVEVFAGDDNNNRIFRRLLSASTTSWTATTYSSGSTVDDVTGTNAGGGCNGPGGNFPACQPRFLKLSPSGKLYASNWGGDGITSYTLPATATQSCPSSGCVDPSLVVSNLQQPAGLYFVDATHLVVVDRGANAVFLLTKTSGTF